MHARNAVKTPLGQNPKEYGIRSGYTDCHTERTRQIIPFTHNAVSTMLLVVQYVVHTILDFRNTVTW